MKGEGKKSRCITGSENKTSCMRKSRAIEETQKEDQMTECHGLGVRKASNVVINGTGLRRKSGWQTFFFLFACSAM